jgi:hypothetical protein
VHSGPGKSPGRLIFPSVLPSASDREYQTKALIPLYSGAGASYCPQNRPSEIEQDSMEDIVPNTLYSFHIIVPPWGFSIIRCPDSGILEFILSSAMVPRILDVHFAGLSKIPVSILRGVF